MTPARRLAAILTVDFDGQLRLMGEDEGGDGTAVCETLRGARCARHARSEMPSQDLQVTMTAVLECPLGR